VLFAVITASCTITGSISRKGTAAEIQHTTKQQREYVEEKQEEHREGYIEYTKVDSTKIFLIPTVKTADGETTMQLNIEAVTVTAPLRSIPERNGKVSLDFVVTLPKELMGSCRGVEVTPFLIKDNDKFALDDLTIRGMLFNKVQERNYWQYERYIDVFRPNEIGRQWAYERFIYYPYPEGTRLDSVVANKTTISYYYTQDVPTKEVEDNRLLITLRGKVVALDHSDYTFALSDTLTYNISSMLNFVDMTTRYMTRVTEKYVVVNDRNYLNFKVNRSNIADTLADNREQLARIDGLMDQIINQKEFHIDSIILTASASPEGSVRWNERLAKDRAYSLRNRLVRQFPKSRLDTLITVRWIGEDWTEFERLLRMDENVKNRMAISDMITKNGKDNRDNLEKEIKRKFPEDYKYMLAILYPKLRAVSFKYDLRRVGMVKDTIHTTVPDTLYARGVGLLKKHKYHEALAVLDGFYDRNTAICLLSLGLDERAYNILNNLPESSTNCYLMAIACARLRKEEDALAYFDRAVELNENMKWRGRLDPEISTLSNRYGNKNE
jgi:tetratricopeptide (TPR) repeat protein